MGWNWVQKEAAQLHYCFYAEEDYGHTHPRVRESFMLEGSFCGLQSHTCLKQELLNSDQVTQGHVQPHLETSQDRDSPDSGEQSSNKFQSLSIIRGFYFLPSCSPKSLSCI